MVSVNYLRAAPRSGAMVQWTDYSQWGEPIWKLMAIYGDTGGGVVYERENSSGEPDAAAVCSCSHSHNTTLDLELQRLVGQTATFSGKFEFAGKVGPYIHRAGEPVYLMPHGSFSWGSEYEKMQGKVVSITGILRFRHFDRVKTNTFSDQPADYYYFDAEKTKIRLE
jgi:hypothetical protein